MEFIECVVFVGDLENKAINAPVSMLITSITGYIYI